MKKLIFLFLLLLVSCSNKSIPKQSEVSGIIPKNYDTTLATFLQTLKNEAIQKDTITYDSVCTTLKDNNIKLKTFISLQSNIIDSLLCEPKTVVLIDKSKKKIKNSFNDTQKNSNNTTEIIKMKNSMLIQADTIGQLHTDKNILGSKVKDLEKENTRLKNSTTGENSPNTNKSGNTTKKASWYLWLIVFVAGGITSLGTRAIITKTI